METTEKNELVVSDEKIAEMNSQLTDANGFMYLFLDHIYPIPPHGGGRVFFSAISMLDKLAEMGLGMRVVRIEPGSWQPWNKKPAK